MRILQVTSSLGMGGAETWLMEVLRLWRTRGQTAPEMDFLATSGERGIFDDEAMALGARIHYLQYGRRHLRSFSLGLRRILNAGGYAAIHDHQDYASGWHFLMGGRHLPLVRITHVHNPVYQIRNNYGVTLGRRITAVIGKRLVGIYATHIAGTSRQVVSEYGFDARPFQRITRRALHCGFEPDRFIGDPAAHKASVCAEFGWPAKAKILLFAGRTDHCPDLGHPLNHKNSGFAVQVGIECAKRDSLVRMVMCGAPSHATPILLDRIEATGCAGRIVPAGIRRDIERFMLASDLLLFPSRGEGLGMVAVEAQAAGLRILASDRVPRECLVVPELVTFLPLEAGPCCWANHAKRLLNLPKPDGALCNRTVAESPFAIKKSAARLAAIYSSGLLTG